MLDSIQKKSWNASLRTCSSPWIAFGVDEKKGNSNADRLAGMAGLIDWHLHGQVSTLVSRKVFSQEEFCLFPSVDRKNTFLLYHFAADADAKSFLSQLKLLNVKEICLAETTFPEDFLHKVKQTLKKEGIRCTKLEPESL